MGWRKSRTHGVPDPADDTPATRGRSAPNPPQRLQLPGMVPGGAGRSVGVRRHAVGRTKRGPVRHRRSPPDDRHRSWSTWLSRVDGSGPRTAIPCRLTVSQMAGLSSKQPADRAAGRSGRPLGDTERPRSGADAVCGLGGWNRCRARQRRQPAWAPRRWPAAAPGARGTDALDSFAGLEGVLTSPLESRSPRSPQPTAKSGRSRPAR
jgi:hypothetical protein